MSRPAGARTGVAVVVVAGGSGRRMATPTNKIFLPIAGRPILARTLDVFDGLAIVDTIVLVVAPGDRLDCEALVRDGAYAKVDAIVEGGASRHDSEFAGLLAIEAMTPSGVVDTILVHDAVRPFVTARQIEELVAMARATGAAILAIPVADRLVTLTGDGTVEAAGDELWVAQTPQAFRASLVFEAHRRAAADGFKGTDTSSVVERTGQPVSLVLGGPENIKITTPDDLARAAFILGRPRGPDRSAELELLTARP
jgi:2-C-methyl-D-erythritol 4-phosphate cytidylyltransferase